MPSDTIRLGNFVFSRVFLDALIPLISVIVGGLITYFTTQALERRRWKEQQKTRLLERKREALEKALLWIDIVERDVTAATLVAGNYIDGRIDESEFRKRWPRLLTKLAETDLPPHLGILLPANTYKLGLQIVRQLDELYSLSLEARDTKSGQWQKYHQTYLDITVKLYDQAKIYRELLTKEYLKTFDAVPE